MGRHVGQEFALPQFNWHDQHLLRYDVEGITRLCEHLWLIVQAYLTRRVKESRDRVITAFK